MGGTNYLLYCNTMRDSDTHSSLQNNLKNYGQIRHFHRGSRLPNIYDIVYMMIGNLVAEAVNMTLIGKGHPSYPKNHIQQNNWINPYPTFVPVVSKTKDIYSDYLYTWNIYYKNPNSLEFPSYTQSMSSEMNFVYCDIPQTKYTSVWDFRIFGGPFDKWIWTFSIISLAMITLLTYLDTKASISTALFYSLSVLLNDFMECIIECRKVFVIWMFIATQLVDLYTGELTSAVIQPYPEARMKAGKEFKGKNFKILFHRGDTGRWVRNIIQEINMGNRSENLVVLGKLLENFEVEKNESLRIKKYAQTGNKYAMVADWYRVISIALDVNEFITSQKSKKFNQKKCYVGEEVINKGAVFYGFLPPGSGRLGRVVVKLFSAGFVYRLLEYAKMMSAAKRTQDRNKVKTKIRFEDKTTETEVVTLKMEGKIISVFLVLFICLSGCLICFMFEIVRHKSKNRVTKIKSVDKRIKNMLENCSPNHRDLCHQSADLDPDHLPQSSTTEVTQESPVTEFNVPEVV